MVNKVAFSGFLTAMLVASGAAVADEVVTAVTLPTKNYVDDGLRYVYQVATDASDAASQNATSISTLASSIEGYADLVGGKADQVDLESLADIVNDEETGLAALSNIINDEETGLATKASLSDLQELQQTVGGMDGTSYEGANGVIVDGHNVELDVEAEAGKMYIYTSTGWEPLPVQDTWNPNVLTGTSGNTGG